MKTITRHYSPGLNWIDVLAENIGGVIEGNFITGDNEMYKGIHFVLPIEEGITAILTDATYNEELLFQYRNENSNFIGVYFYLTNMDVDFILKDKSTQVGKFNYNLSIVDCEIDTSYIVQKDTRIFVISILFDKDVLKKFFLKIPDITSIADLVFNTERNAIIRMDRMSSENLILINDFRKIPHSSSLYEVYFKGLVYELISNYLNQLKTKENIIDKAISDDVKSIIASKLLLQNNIEGAFPGIDFLAEQVSMSPSKYKKLFIKISGINPGSYFANHKLNRAKELLETGNFTVNEVAHKLNYANVSYLAKRFNQVYGIFPKKYQSLF